MRAFLTDDHPEIMIHLRRNGAESAINRSPIGQSGERNEAWLRDLIFRHPRILPIRDVDPRALDLVPVCTELPLGQGRADALFIDHRGRLTLVECKLWKNPQARREVIGQIIDYAAELSKLSYEDLDKKIVSRRGELGSALYRLVRENLPTLSEAVFVDGVSEGLRNGDFTMLIVGDGIKRETEQIRDYLTKHARMQSRFGLIEVAVYDLNDGSTIIHPRVLTRTIDIERFGTQGGLDLANTEASTSRRQAQTRNDVPACEDQFSVQEGRQQALRSNRNNVQG